MRKQKPDRAARLTSLATRAVGYAGLAVYVYWGIIRGHEVSELFLVIIALLIQGDRVLEYMGSRKK